MLKRESLSIIYKRVNCVEPAIRFELLNKQLGTLLLEYALSDTMLDWLRDRINQDVVESERLQLSARAELQSMIANLERKQSILVDSYLKQDIDRPTFLTKKSHTISAENSKLVLKWCPRWDLNPYEFPHSILSRERIPIPPLGRTTPA